MRGIAAAVRVVPESFAPVARLNSAWWQMGAPLTYQRGGLSSLA